MSGINCGTYPSKNYGAAELIVEEQLAEFDILTSDLDDLQIGVDATNDIYGVNLTTSNFNNATAVSTYEQKPIAFFFDATYNAQMITTASETKVFTNTYDTATSPRGLTFFFNSNVNFLVPEIVPLNGILWRAYVNNVLVSEYIQDFGEYVITDTSSRWNMQFLFEIPAGTSNDSSYVTARLIANSVMDIGVRYGIRYSCLSRLT